jgi:hypothetical protein
MSESHDIIYRVIEFSPFPLGIHELRQDSRLQGMSECSISARLREEPLKSKLFKRQRPGQRYCEWWNKPITEEQKTEDLNSRGLLL